MKFESDPQGAQFPAFRAKCAGFTLVELMVTVAVLAVIVAIATPNFVDLVNRNRLTASANEVVAALQTARVEAVRQNGAVSMCPSTSGTTCSGTSWQRFIVFSDEGANGEVDGDDVVIRDVVVAAGNVQVSPSPNLATNHRMRFGANGFVRVGSGGERGGTISVCSTKLPASANTRNVRVAVSRISVDPDHGGSATCAAPADEA